MTSAPRNLVMAIFPNARGFAYSVFEGLLPIDWGISDARGQNRNEACLRRIIMLVQKHDPDVLLLRDIAEVSSERSGRVRTLLEDVTDIAKTRGIRLFQISRKQVREAFDYLDHPTRYAIVQTISNRIRFLQLLVPPPRKIWSSEDRRMGLFDAVALVLTYHESGPFESLG